MANMQLFALQLFDGITYVFGGSFGALENKYLNFVLHSKQTGRVRL